MSTEQTPPPKQSIKTNKQINKIKPKQKKKRQKKAHGRTSEQSSDAFGPEDRRQGVPRVSVVMLGTDRERWRVCLRSVFFFLGREVCWEEGGVVRSGQVRYE